MTNEEIETKISRFRMIQLDHELNNRPISAKMVYKTISALKKHLKSK